MANGGGDGMVSVSGFCVGALFLLVLIEIRIAICKLHSLLQGLIAALVKEEDQDALQRIAAALEKKESK